jgi:formylglycine-generating enzyme required for sulfatase activity
MIKTLQSGALFVAILVICTVASGAAFQMEMAAVPYDSTDSATQQPNGPEYSFNMGRYEVTVAQYMAFLNDAEANQGNERGANLSFLANGDVGLPIEDADRVFSLAANNANGFFNYGISYHAGQPVGSRYGYDSAFAQHPIVGVSWYGAVKFCNWLTIDQGLPLAERVYNEGSGSGDWRPKVATQPLTSEQRRELVDSYAGFRLPMDENGNTGAGAFNEWHKAAAWDGDAMVDRVYGFGRDVLTTSDANWLSSGDLWETGTTPVGYYNGINPDTNTNENYYGIYDLSGNAMEWMQDWDIGGRRTERGGVYYDLDPALRLRVDHPRNAWPRSTGSSNGFRVVQVPEPATLSLLALGGLALVRRRKGGMCN